MTGLILAAGESRRMGSPKALLPIRGTTFLDHLIGLFAESCERVIVVLGCEPETITAGMSRAGDAAIVVNPDYGLGQLSSMQRGLRAVPAGMEAVLFTLVDHPDPAASTIQALLDAPAAPVTVPMFHGRRGHPVRFDRELIPEFLALPPDGSAKTVVRSHRAQVIEVDDPGILDDIDDPAALEKFRLRL